MICPSCGRQLGPLPAVCRPCGKRYVPKKLPASDVHAAKTQPTPQADLHSLPTRPAPVVRRPGVHNARTRPAPRRRAAAAPVPKAPDPAKKKPFLIAGAAIAVVLGASFFGWKVMSTPAVPDNFFEEQTHLIQGRMMKNAVFPEKGSYAFRLEVTSLDGPIQAYAGGVSNPRDPQAVRSELVVSEGAKQAKLGKGETRILEGRIEGTFPMWMVFNLHDSRSVRVKIKLTLEESRSGS